jgi:chromosome segregation ATPase
VYARELEASRKEKRLAKREEALDQREAVVTELRAKLSAMNEILEEQQIQQTTAVERIQKWERELEDKASNIALAEENLKEKDASLDRREADLAWREKDLAWRARCRRGNSSVGWRNAPSLNPKMRRGLSILPVC